MANKASYVQCDASEIPAGVRFDTPARNQGQIVVVAYGTQARAEAGHGAPWMRVFDSSDRSAIYYRREAP